MRQTLKYLRNYIKFPWKKDKLLRSLNAFISFYLLYEIEASCYRLYYESK